MKKGVILIKRHTAEFKAIKTMITDYVDVPLRKRWILIYTQRSYSKLENKILLNTVKKDSDILYSLAYDSLHEYMHSKNKKLFREEKGNIYYFKSSSLSKMIEMPFEFAGKLKKELSKVLVIRKQESKQPKIIKHPASKRNLR
jgi:hypothetical protein